MEGEALGLPYGSLRGRVVIAAQSSLSRCPAPTPSQSQGVAAEIMDAAEVGFLLLRAWKNAPRAGSRQGWGEQGERGPWPVLAALCLQATAWGPGAREPSTGPPGPLPSTLARPTLDRISYWGRLEAWLSRSVSQSWRAGEGGARRACEVPTAPEVGAGWANLKPRWFRHVFTYSVSFPEIFNVH